MDRRGKQMAAEGRQEGGWAAEGKQEDRPSHQQLRRG